MSTTFICGMRTFYLAAAPFFTRLMQLQIVLAKLFFMKYLIMQRSFFFFLVTQIMVCESFFGLFQKAAKPEIRLNADKSPMEKPKIANSIVECIGGTPIVRLNRVQGNIGANILLKLESMEPCNSVKDRIGKSMIEEAENIFASFWISLLLYDSNLYTGVFGSKNWIPRSVDFLFFSKRERILFLKINQLYKLK